MSAKGGGGNRSRRSRWVAAAGIVCGCVLLIVVMAFVFAGAPLAPFHGDEGMHIYSSNDHDYLRRDGVLSLVTSPPYEIDSDAHFRLAAGTVYRHTLGFVRHLAGAGPEHLPPRPGWLWVASFEQNVRGGYFPKLELIALGRTTSSAFTALSALPAFWFGWLLWGSTGAWLMAGLLLLHPAVLLNGRRAMQEGCLLFFGMVTLAAGCWLAGKILSGRQPKWWQWGVFSTAGGLALASKLSGLCFFAPALAVILVAVFRSGWAGHTARRFAPLAFAAAGAFALFSRAFARSLEQALGAASRSGGDSCGIDQLCQRRSRSGLGEAGPAACDLAAPDPAAVFRGSRMGGNAQAGGGCRSAGVFAVYGLRGVALWGWAVVGLAVFAVWRVFRQKEAFGIGLLAAFALCAALIFPNPLPWQRNYLPLLPFWLALAIYGAKGVMELLRERPQQVSRLSAAPLL